MTCIIIEDQPPAQRILKKYIADMGTMELVGTFVDAVGAITFLQTTKVDLIFLDIHLPKMSGLDFLKSLANPPQVILTTAFADYALESYEFSVVDYLLKPFSFQRFVKAVTKVKPQVKNNSSRDTQAQATFTAAKRRELFIKSGYEHVKIVIDDIQYIKSDADYTDIVTARKKYLSAEPLRYWLQALDDSQFVQVHKSYIINAQHITKVSGNQVFFSDTVVVPIGRSYKERFMERFVK